MGSLKNWVLKHLEQEDIPDFKYLNKDRNIFQIPWPRFSDVNLQPKAILDYAEHTGRFIRGQEEPNIKDCKQRLRVALQKSNYFVSLSKKELIDKKIEIRENQARFYQIKKNKEKIKHVSSYQTNQRFCSEKIIDNNKRKEVHQLIPLSVLEQNNDIIPEKKNKLEIKQTQNLPVHPSEDLFSKIQFIKEKKIVQNSESNVLEMDDILKYIKEDGIDMMKKQKFELTNEEQIKIEMFLKIFSDENLDPCLSLKIKNNSLTRFYDPLNKNLKLCAEVKIEGSKLDFCLRREGFNFFFKNLNEQKLFIDNRELDFHQEINLKYEENEKFSFYTENYQRKFQFKFETDHKKDSDFTDELSKKFESKNLPENLEDYSVAFHLKTSEMESNKNIEVYKVEENNLDFYLKNLNDDFFLEECCWLLEDGSQNQTLKKKLLR